MKNCKVLPGEACLTQHRFLWTDIVIRGKKKRIWKREEMKIKPWKLKDPIKSGMFEERVSDRIEGANIDHTVERQQGGDRETWWWNEEVQLAVRKKKLAFNRWQSEGTKEAHEQY